MNRYLEQRSLFPPLIQKEVPTDLAMCICIPTFNEAKIVDTLDSLAACERISASVEVLIALNHTQSAREEVKSQNAECKIQMEDWEKNNKPSFSLHVLDLQNLEDRFKGVGVARKIVMDEACRRICAVNKSKEAVLVCLDADCLVSPNYFEAIHTAFQNPAVISAGIYFEHPIQGSGYSQEIYTSIIQYELHLRYFRRAKKWAGLPHAFFTVGSSMAVRCEDYMKQGGMNRRQAGEDFYFLHKFIELGKHIEMNETTVFPSPRISDRVPFGTGKAVGDMQREDVEFHSYALESFLDLKSFLLFAEDLFEEKDLTERFSQFPNSIQQFIGLDAFVLKMKELKEHTKSKEQFTKRFYRWFNAFQVMKFVHYCRDHFYPDVEVTKCAMGLLNKLDKEVQHDSAKELLITYRDLDRKL